MEHKITIEILIKTDFSKSEDKTIPKFNALQINPDVIKSLLPKFMDGLINNLSEELPKEKKETPKYKISKSHKKTKVHRKKIKR